MKSLHHGQRVLVSAEYYHVGFRLGVLAVAAPSDVVVCAVLVAHLPARLATSVLASLHKAGVPVRADDPVVQPRAVHEPHAVLRVLPGVVLDEAEATRRLLELVQAHDDALDVAALGKQLVDLAFGRVERQVAHVHGRGQPQQLVQFTPRALEVLVAVRAQFRHGSSLNLNITITNVFTYETALRNFFRILFWFLVNRRPPNTVVFVRLAVDAAGEASIGGDAESARTTD